MKFCLTLAATVLLGAISLEAHAQQPWLSDRQYGEGIGVRVGNLELHPGIAAEVGYDSNYFLRSGTVNNQIYEPVLSAYRLRVTPSISLETLGPQRREGSGTQAQTNAVFRGDAYASYNELIATDSAHSTEFANQRHVDLGADLALTLFPKAQLGPDAYVNFIRSVQPSNSTDTQDAFNRDGLRFGAGLTWRPGGGLFQWRLGYEGLYNYFEKSAFKYLNNFQNQVNVRGNWRFLPRTALLYDGSYTWINYANNSTTERDGAIVRSRIGMNGLITTRWSLLAMVGWAGTFYNSKVNEAPQQFDSVTGQLELRWFLSGGGPDNLASAPVGLSYASLGYTRDVGNSYLGNFYQKDRGYVGVSYLLGGVFVASLNAGIANLKFPTAYFANPADGVQNPEFSEQRVDVNLFAEYRLSNSFGVNTTVNYDQNITDVIVPSSPEERTLGQGDELKFSRWQVFLGARYFL